jgi:glycosyltransferase involved in cell wall biosynthesis
VTNWHRFGGGSDYIARATTDILRQHGHEVELMGHDSSDYGRSLRGKVEASWRGVYSRRACVEMAETIKRMRPDLVHVHELYPYHSPWILRVCHDAGIPIVMTCHDFRLTCPIATHMRKGSDCNLCANGATHWCLVHNCRGNYLESAAYAARSLVADVSGVFARYVSAFITPSHFLRRHLVRAGFAPGRVAVVENMVASVPFAVTDPGRGGYAAYAGRIAPEKSIELLLDAARKIGVPVRVAGGSPPPEIRSCADDNVTWVGNLNARELAAFYRNARMVVVPSRWREVFGLVAAEAMMHGIPVVASNSGALPELVRDSVTGLLFKPGDVDDLARKIRRLWDSPDLCQTLGKAGRLRAIERYTAERYCERIVSVYRCVMEGNPVDMVEIPVARTAGVGVAS